MRPGGARALRRAARLAAVLAVSGGPACAGDAWVDADPSGADTSDADSTRPWGLPVELELRAEGGRWLSAPLGVAGGGRGFALFVEGEGCAQVAQLESGALQRVWVPALERGVSCAECTERVSVLAGSGLVVHAPAAPDDADATIRFGAIDCESLTPLPAASSAGPPAWRAWARALPLAGDVEQLALEFHQGTASPWSSPRDAARLAAEVGALLAPAGLEVELLDSSTAPWLDAPIEWFEGTPCGLPRVAGDVASVQVMFGGCLERVHPLLGTRVLLDGFVPRVPAQGSPGAGVYVRHRSCSNDTAVVRSAEREARLIAHELGHYLGLYHPEDPGAQRDRLADTEDDTLMSAKPVAEPFFSRLQAARLRLHAALLADGLPSRSPR